MPQYPILALLGAIGVFYLLQFLTSIAGGSGRLLKIQQLVVAGKVIFGAVLFVFIVQILPSTEKSLARVPVEARDRHNYINDHTKHFGIMLSLQIEHPNEKIYQLGLESGLFYGPRLIYGDHFGPWRYRDFEILSAYDLHKKLHAQDFTIIAVNRNNRIADKTDFKKYFFEVLNNNEDKAYRVLGSK